MNDILRKIIFLELSFKLTKRKYISFFIHFRIVHQQSSTHRIERIVLCFSDKNMATTAKKFFLNAYRPANSTVNQITTNISILSSISIAWCSYSSIVEKTLKAKHVNTIKNLHCCCSWWSIKVCMRERMNTRAPISYKYVFIVCKFNRKSSVKSDADIIRCQHSKSSALFFFRKRKQRIETRITRENGKKM